MDTIQQKSFRRTSPKVAKGSSVNLRNPPNEDRLNSEPQCIPTWPEPACRLWSFLHSLGVRCHPFFKQFTVTRHWGLKGVTGTTSRCPEFRDQTNISERCFGKCPGSFPGFLNGASKAFGIRLGLGVLGFRTFNEIVQGVGLSGCHVAF